MTTDSKLSDISIGLAAVKSDLAEIKTDLREHMRRTAAAEARIDQMEQPVKDLVALGPDIKRLAKLAWAGLGALVMAVFADKPEILAVILKVLGLSTGVSP